MEVHPTSQQVVPKSGIVHLDGALQARNVSTQVVEFTTSEVAGAVQTFDGFAFGFGDVLDMVQSLRLVLSAHTIWLS